MEKGRKGEGERQSVAVVFASKQAGKFGSSNNHREVEVCLKRNLTTGNMLMMMEEVYRSLH
jgi:hypothetical protein